jgi:hypothetical protein
MKTLVLPHIIAATVSAHLAFSQTPALPSPSELPSLAERASSFVPDAAAVQRFGAGYRFPQHGWIVVHLEGGPYERGVQHGRLLAPEIVGYLRCYANMLSPDGASDGWRLARTIANTTFLRGFDREYLEEMKGIADGATAAGARYDERAIDLIDIAALNLWPELMTLDAANEATPTGLEGIVFPDAGPSPAKSAQPERCSAFAATGKATRDGHPVIGHITMFSLYAVRWYNVWLDIQPDHGHRLTMQSYPAGIYSGMDYYLNDARIAMVETTIEQTRFEPRGTPLASRARRAMQYGDSIDSVVAMLKDGNNGLYNNEWLLADMKTDEIAMYELGTHASKLWRSSRDEWYGGTPGFYWGCNNPKDLTMRMETIPATNDRPADMVWHPSDRDLKWLELYRNNFGKMDESFAARAFTTAPLCSSASVDAKFTSSAMAKSQQSWALFGPPLQHTWMPTPEENRRFRDICPLVSNPWTVLGPAVPVTGLRERQPAPVDLHDPTGVHLLTGLFGPAGDKEKDDVRPPTKPAWHGTILPASDADLWLATAFAQYEKIVSLEHGYSDAQTNKCLCTADYDSVADSLFAARARYFAGARKAKEVALAAVKWDPASDAWYKVASGKGVLILAELRRLMGDTAFARMMDEFGRNHAGQQATSAEFAAHAAKAAARDLGPFFKYWLSETGLPRIELLSASASSNTVHGVIGAQGGPLPSNLEVTVEYGDDDELTQVGVVDAEGHFEIPTSRPARRLVVDKYARMARGNGSEADLSSFADDIDHTLIVYGTADDTAANHEAAEDCQKAIRASWHNIALPIKADTGVSDAELKSHHLILIGRPEANALTARMARALPVVFGPASFAVRNHTYANMASAVLAACVNPVDQNFSVVVLAGNSAAATVAHAGDLARGGRHEVKVFDPSGKAKTFVVPAPELIHNFDSTKLTARGF